jgi:hypothetical protein
MKIDSRTLRALFIGIVFSLITGCSEQMPVSTLIVLDTATVARIESSQIPTKAETIKIITLFALTRTTTPNPSTTPRQSPSVTFTPAQAMTATFTPVVTLDTLRKTPPTLMLHQDHPDFDSVKFLEGFLKILKTKDYKLVTYQYISDHPDITATEVGNLFIITIDDIALQAPIDSSINELITLLLDANYPAVLGVTTTGKLADVTTVKFLKELASQGWEIAMHTDTHTDLHQLEQLSPYGARLEIRTCSDKIYQNLGIRPITLVLPYGAMVQDLKILYREHVTWVVGINGGEKYRTTNWVYYVGREGPDGDPEMTYNIMMKRFSVK